jgi:hypothetical protein
MPPSSGSKGKQAASQLASAGFLSGSHFNHEDRGDMFLQNIRPSLICAVLQPKQERQIHSEVIQQHCFICANAMDGMV